MNFAQAFDGPTTVEEDGTVVSHSSRSSAASGYHHDGPITFAELVDLTSPLKCRVLMSGRTHLRVCGNDASGCTRRYHKTIVQDPTRRGAPAWYLSVRGSGGVVDGNGREPSYSTEEARALQRQEVQEQAAALADLGPPDESLEGAASRLQEHAATLERFGDPEESLGASFHVEFREDTLASEHQDTPAVRNPKTPSRASVRAPSNHQTATSGEGGEPDPPVETWYGLENSETADRIATQDQERARFLSTVGWHVRRIFDAKADADHWVSLARPTASGFPTHRQRHPRAPPTPVGAPAPAPPTPPPSVGGGGTPKALFGMEHPKHGDRTIAHCRADADILTESGFVIKKLFYDLVAAEKWAAGACGPTVRPDTNGFRHARRTGPDKSTTTQEVFGVNINRFDEVDRLMLPADTPLESADDYYDCAADVLALPGGYRSLDRDDEATDDSVAIAMLAMVRGQKQTGLHVRFGAAKYNGLNKVKTGDDLPEFMETLHETYANAEEGMESQFTRKMHAAGHSPESVEDYLQNGVLPRVVRDTYRFYSRFLTTLAGYVSQAAAHETWDTSIARLLHKHHLDQLALIRETSASYRDLVLRNYAYLRKQYDTNFWNDKLSKKAALLTTRLMAGARTPGPGPSTDSDKCPTCLRKHSSRPPCPTAPLTKAERTRLGKGLTHRKYEKALKALKAGFSEDPNADHAALIDEARRAAEA